MINEKRFVQFLHYPAGYIFHFFFQKLKKIKINDLNEKCNLLEQSLRVIAQENHDLEKIKNLNSPNISMKKNSSSPIVAAAATAAVNTTSTNSDEENFYDLGQ